MRNSITRITWAVCRARFEQIRDDTPRQWGELDPARMIRHVRLSTELSLAEVEAKDESTWWTRTVFCWLVFNVLPWPKGKIKVSEVFLPKPDGNVAAERILFFEAMERFLAAVEKEPQRRTTHPMFGPRTMHNWRQIHGKHFDHHLRQFGV